jgi:wyosine [tRNA(Phe)-imidazoG37] synthetase (radical SAM superfamily)
MATFLFDKIIFGPISSRRLGASLGINLLPTQAKVCNFNCIYCECGWNDTHGTDRKLPDRLKVKADLEQKLKLMFEDKEPLDVITFAGNGEPTMHPEFGAIIEDTLQVRDAFFPEAKVAVLSNATLLHKPAVVEALKKVDQPILKLDSAFDTTVQLLNQPPANFSIPKVVEQLKAFKGDFILQTLFVQGEHNGQIIDNTSESELNAWLAIVKEVAPREVMIYTIARDTPVQTLRKASADKLDAIARELRAMGIKVQVSF